MIVAYTYAAEEHGQWMVGVCSEKSMKKTQQDRYTFQPFEHNGEQGLLAAVFDGHGRDEDGHKVAEMVNNKFCNYFKERLQNSNDIKKALQGAYEDCHELVFASHTKLYIPQHTDTSYANVIEFRINKNAINGYSSIGSTGIASVIYNDKVAIANLGDSRAYIKINDKFFATRDHKPNDPEEQEYYNLCEQNVAFKRQFGTNIFRTIREKNRIEYCDNSVNISRCFGDYEYKLNAEKTEKLEMMAVREEADITKHEVSENSYIILASDGFWDVVTNEEVDTLVQTISADTNSEEEIAKRLTTYAVKEKGSEDNTTVIFIRYKKQS